MTGPLEPARWHKVNTPGVLAYWRRDLQPEGRYLTVTRTPDGHWRWRLRGPDQLPEQLGGGAVVHHESHNFPWPARARQAADRYVGPTGFRCPHGCGPLTDGGAQDPHPQLVCPRCGDEWDAQAMAAPGSW